MHQKCAGRSDSDQGTLAKSVEGELRNGEKAILEIDLESVGEMILLIIVKFSKIQ
jgi:hypothetical protein